MSETDLQLLTRYVSQRAEDAFAEVVRRHVDLVHSAALRQVRSPELAEEVAQAVFIELAGQAPHLPPRTVLAAWLYHVTRRRAIDVVRREAGRRLREQTAQELQAMNATAEDWGHIEPLLDDAMDALEETDRLAVLLRYFQNKPLHEVGQAMGVTDDAAQKRVSRAVERLREFFAKRGVTVGASGLVVTISANAVQAAPVGLVATISTSAAAIAGTAIATTTIAAATQAIAMTTFQKAFIAATLVAAIGTGTYEAHQASMLRAQLETVRQQQAQLAIQVEQLTRERDTATTQLAALRNDNAGPDNMSELLRLRAEVTRLRTDAQARVGSTNDQTLSEAVVWKNRVKQLKQRLEQSPAANIPELQFVTEKDWLAAAKGSLDTESDYRRSLSAIRDAGENKVASMLQKALAAYMKASNEQFPTDLTQLQPYFDPPMDETVLQRWQVAPAASVQSLGLGGDKIITQKAPVDDVFDTRYGIGPLGSGGTDFFPFRETYAVISPVRDAYRAAHNGQEAEDKSELLPYATTPEQQAAVQKIVLRESRSR